MVNLMEEKLYRVLVPIKGKEYNGKCAFMQVAPPSSEGEPNDFPTRVGGDDRNGNAG